MAVLRSRSKRSTFCFVIVLCSAFISGCVSNLQNSGQVADAEWSPTVARPEFPHGDGPIVQVDAAHGNFHTIDGRFAAFAELLTLDGFQVRSADVPVTPELLARADVYVVSNAVLGGDDAEWTLPTPQAFAPQEIEAIADWVRSGGSLLLIADHMPFPGSSADLANAFGIVFLNGYAKKSLHEGGSLSFTRASGLLADHAITRGRNESETISSVSAFTGQAFRFVAAAEPLMIMPDDWQVFLPVAAGEFDEHTAVVSARGLVQGGAMRFGAGRVAVFGEAAMFTAQSWMSDGAVGRMGMNHPSAAENAQFVLNVMRWLVGRLDKQLPVIN
jgi:hypothetical protein